MTNTTLRADARPNVNPVGPKPAAQRGSNLPAATAILQIINVIALIIGLSAAAVMFATADGSSWIKIGSAISVALSGVVGFALIGTLIDISKNVARIAAK